MRIFESIWSKASLFTVLLAFVAALFALNASFATEQPSDSELAIELLVVDQPHCPYCERFDAEIAPAYPKTEEGKRAPMVRVQLNKPWPEAYASIKPARFTPTFILVQNGEEIDRIEGYPGDQHFWFLLTQLLNKAH